MKRVLAGRFIVDGLGRAAMLGVTVYLARILGVETFGRLVFAISLANIAYYVSEFGTHLVFLREMGKHFGESTQDQSGQKIIWSEFLGLKLLLSLAVLVTGSLASLWIWPWDSPWILILVLGWVMSNSLVDFFHQACNSVHDVNTSAWVMGAHRFLVVFFVLGFLRVSKTLETVSLALCLGGFLGAFGGFAVIKSRLGFVGAPGGRWPQWFHWIRVSFPLGVANVCGSTYVKLGVIILPWLGLERETGYFGAAHKIFEAGYMVPMAFVVILMPHLSRLIENRAEAFRREVFRSLLYLSGLAALWFVAGELLVDWGVGFLLGEAYRPSVPILRILIGVNVLVFFNFFLTTLLILFNQQGRHAVNEVICLVAGGLLVYGGAAQAGGVGADWAMMAIEVLLMVLTVYALMRVRNIWGALADSLRRASVSGERIL